MRKFYFVLALLWFVDASMILYGWPAFNKAFALTICTNFAFILVDQGLRR